ncbi:dihydroneopterin aldolase [Sulfurimonas sp.]|uniref:dihydroneopterin aldolase n=1 Tax=Sulfurimonas sp. TaxID=2022749 RepID=UPI00260E3475|nr:dihydroneopterin aldolase [Sulfurimonas sp.]
MTVYIEDFKFQCIIGILDFERVQEQDVIVNLTIEYDYKINFINYAEVADHIKISMKKNKFLLIEDALNNLSLSLKKNFINIDVLYLKITKPSILAECSVSVANKYNFIS